MRKKLLNTFIKGAERPSSLEKFFRPFLNSIATTQLQQFTLQPSLSHLYKLSFSTQENKAHEQATQLHGVLIKINQLDSGAAGLKAKAFTDLFDRMHVLHRSKTLTLEDFGNRPESEKLMKLLRGHLDLFTNPTDFQTLLGFCRVFYSDAEDLLTHMASLVSSSQKYTAIQLTDIAEIYYQRSNQFELESLRSSLLPQMHETLKLLLNPGKPLDSNQKTAFVRLLYSTFLLEIGVGDFLQNKNISSGLIEITKESLNILTEQGSTSAALVLKALHLIKVLKLEPPADAIENLEKCLIDYIPELSDTDVVLSALIYSEISTHTQSTLFWQTLEEFLIYSIRTYPSNYIPSLVHSFTTTQHGSLGLFMEFDRVLGVFIEDLDIEKLPLVIYDFALSGKHREKLFRLVEEKIIDNLLFFTPEDLGKIMWGYSKTLYMSEKLLRSLEKSLYDHVENLDEAHFSMLLNSLSIINPQSLLVEKVDNVLKSLLGNRANTPCEEIVLGACYLYLERNELKRLQDTIPEIKEHLLRVIKNAEFPTLTRLGELFTLQGHGLEHYEKFVDADLKGSFTERGLELKRSLEERQKHDLFDFVSDMQSPNLKKMRLELFSK
jgi:hypothetical protein